MYKRALVWGAILAALAVVLGAFGAHSLKKVMSQEMLLVFETGVRYHFYHSVALLITGIVYMQLGLENVFRGNSAFQRLALCHSFIEHQRQQHWASRYPYTYWWAILYSWLGIPGFRGGSGQIVLQITM